MHDQSATARAQGAEGAEALARAFRLGYAAKLALAIVVGAAVAIAVVYAALAEDLGTFAQNAAIIGRTRQSVIAAATISGLLHVVLTGSVAIFLALFASHRIAGPTVRLARVLREVGDGKLPCELRLRAGDQVEPLAARFNEVCQALYDRHEAMKQKLESVRAAEVSLRQMADAAGSGEECRTAADELRAQADELSQLLSATCGERAEHSES